MLLSKDLNSEAIQNFEKIYGESGFLLLDESEVVPQISFASFMRSGNSLSRKIFEKVSGIATGCNYYNAISTSFSLTVMGFKGGQKCENQVWTVKNHYPFKVADFAFKATRGLILVRNPLDLLVSIWMLAFTITHTCTMLNDFSKDFPEAW